MTELSPHFVFKKAGTFALNIFIFGTATIEIVTLVEHARKFSCLYAKIL